MSEGFHAKVSGELMISERFPLHVTVEAWEPWGSDGDPYPGQVTLEMTVQELHGQTAPVPFVTFTGELRRVPGFEEPFFIPEQSPDTVDGDPGPNALWVGFNTFSEGEKPFGPFRIPLTQDLGGFNLGFTLTAPNHVFETAFLTTQRTREWILKVEPLSQQSTPANRKDWPSAARWPLGQQIRDTFHGGAEWPDRNWGKVLVHARKGGNWKRDAGTGFSFGTSGCSYLVTTMLLRYLRTRDPDAADGNLASVFDIKVGRLFAAADRATDAHWPRKSKKHFKKNGDAGAEGAEITSATSLGIDGFIPKVDADTAAEYFPAQLGWLVRSRGKEPAYTAKRETYTKGGKSETVEWFVPGRSLSATGWSDKWGLVPPPWGKKLAAHLDLVPWAETSSFQVKKGFDRRIRDALNDGLPVIGLMGGGDHWCMIVGYRTLDDDSLQFVLNDPGGWKYMQYAAPQAGKLKVPTTHGGKKLGKYVIVQPKDWDPVRAQRITSDWSIIDA